MSAVMQKPMGEPKEISLAVELASFQLIYTFSGPEVQGELSLSELEQFKESLLKPSFIRSQLEIKKRFGDTFEVRSIEVKKGSIIVEASLFALLATGSSPLVIGTVSGIISALVVQRIKTPNEKKKYGELLQKIKTIIHGHSENLSSQDHTISVTSVPVYSPKLKRYKLKTFMFKSKNIKKLQKDVEIAIENYHRIIGKS